MSSNPKSDQPTGKSQDGWVSRNLNRPISRAITRQLLKFPVSPIAWTVAITPLPIAGALLFLRGEYWSSLVAALLYQLYSILDGCDGEIARAKGLESESGRRLDMWCDTAANILLVLSVGIGLSRYGALLYLFEGIAAALLILANEGWLAARVVTASASASDPLKQATYPRHRELIEHSGLLHFGGRFACFLVQIAKRDVAILFFVLLAAINQVAWIVHLLCGTAIVTLALAVTASRRRGRTVTTR